MILRVNLRRGRQIVPGHAIHRSVLKRLRYDRPIDALPTIAAMTGTTDSSPTETEVGITVPAVPAAPDQHDAKKRHSSDASRLSTAPSNNDDNDGTDRKRSTADNTDVNSRASGAKAQAGTGNGGGGGSKSLSKTRKKKDGAKIKKDKTKDNGKGAKKLYDGPKAILPLEWGTDWDQLRKGGGPKIWED